MAVTLKISSTLRALVPGYDPLAGMELDPQPGDRVADILARIGIPHGLVKIVMLNGVASTLDQLVRDGDRLGLFPPVGGG